MSKHDNTKTDFSSFMCIILMLTGALVTIMISNVVVIAANPDKIEITSVVGDINKPVEIDDYGNKKKNPWYVEVLRDRLVIHPGGEIVNIKDLENRDNGFERLLTRVSARKEEQYVVLMVRPYAAHIARQIKKAVVDRKLDVGVDLLEKDVPVNVISASTNFIATGAGAATSAVPSSASPPDAVAQPVPSSPAST